MGRLRPEEPGFTSLVRSSLYKCLVLGFRERKCCQIFSHTILVVVVVKMREATETWPAPHLLFLYS